MSMIVPRSTKTYTVQQAVDAARVRLQGNGVTALCVGKLNGRRMDEILSLAQLNKVADDLVFDTLYYET